MNSEEITDYECARELLNTLMAVYRDEAEEEKTKPDPDMELIDSLGKKIRTLWEQRKVLGREGHEPQKMRDTYRVVLQHARTERDKRQGSGNE